MEKYVKKVCALVLALVLAASLCGCAGTEEPQANTPTATFTPLPSATPSPSPTPTATPGPTSEPLAPELTDRLKLSDNIGGYTANLLDGDAET